MLPNVMPQGLRTPQLAQHNVLPRMHDWLFDSFASGDAVGAGRLGTVTFTPQMRQVFSELYRANVPILQIAERLGVAQETVRRNMPQLMQEFGLSIRPRYSSAPPEVADRMREMYNRGASFTDIGRATGYSSQGGMSNTLRRYGVEPNRATPRSEDVLNQVANLRRDGQSYGQIASSLGLTRNQVAGMVRDLRGRGVQIPAMLAPFGAAGPGLDMTGAGGLAAYLQSQPEGFY